MENSSNKCVESCDTQHNEERDQGEMSWEEIFDGVPTAYGTEAAQERHKQLREQDSLTEEEEVELNELFFILYPQFIPDTWKKCPEHRKETTDRQVESIRMLLLLEICWCWITIIHCGLTIHGFLGCFIVFWWFLLVRHLVNSKGFERVF